MSEDSSRRRRSGDDDDARPVTAAGRRRRAEAGSETGAAGKGASTPSRGRTDSAPEESLIARLRRFLLEVVAELRKVHWPTRRQIVVYTGVVLVFVSFMVALIAGLDAVFARAVFAVFG